jgi:hypothetical protein
MSIKVKLSQLKIIEYQNKIIIDEINANDFMRHELKRTGEAITMTNKKQ